VSARKNIFLIGRRGHERDENQLTEMLAFLWQERPQVLEMWLEVLGLPPLAAEATVEIVPVSEEITNWIGNAVPTILGYVAGMNALADRGPVSTAAADAA
jgi:hypothetical protein